MCSHFDRECQFLYDLTFKRKEREFKEAIDSASENQIGALVEVIVNRERFVDTSFKFNEKSFVKNPRKAVLQNWKKIQKLLAVVFVEVIQCETCLMALSDDE